MLCTFDAEGSPPDGVRWAAWLAQTAPPLHAVDLYPLSVPLMSLFWSRPASLSPTDSDNRIHFPGSVLVGFTRTSSFLQASACCTAAETTPRPEPPSRHWHVYRFSGRTLTFFTFQFLYSLSFPDSQACHLAALQR
jgi:hypothetical protein